MVTRFIPFMMADGDVRTYLTAAVQQLDVLLLLLKEEFKSMCDMSCVFISWYLISHRAERLKHAVVHGRIPLDLLEFYFRKNQQYYYLDDNDDFVREPTVLCETLR